MITEKTPNSYIKEWFSAHDVVRRVVSADAIGKFVREHTTSAQERFWDGDLLTGAYDYGRGKMLESYCAAIGHIFLRYIKDTESGLEFGPGSRASLYKMLPERARREWVMADVSKITVAMANSRINRGNYLAASFHSFPIKEGSQQVVSGFNSFETTMHIERLMQETCNALQHGGYFLALQDVIPNRAGTLFREYLRNGNREVAIYDTKNNGDRDLDAILIESNGILMDARSYHHNILRETGEELGMKTVFYGSVESEGVYKRGTEHGDWFRNLSKFSLLSEKEVAEHSRENSFTNIVSKEDMRKRDDLKEGEIHERVAINALILRK